MKSPRHRFRRKLPCGFILLLLVGACASAPPIASDYPILATSGLGPSDPLLDLIPVGSIVGETLDDLRVQAARMGGDAVVMVEPLDWVRSGVASPYSPTLTMYGEHRWIARGEGYRGLVVRYRFAPRRRLGEKPQLVGPWELLE